MEQNYQENIIQGAMFLLDKKTWRTHKAIKLLLL